MGNTKHLVAETNYGWISLHSNRNDRVDADDFKIANYLFFCRESPLKIVILIQYSDDWDSDGNHGNGEENYERQGESLGHKDNHDMMMMIMIMMKIMIIIIEEWRVSDLPVRDVWMRGIRVGAICRMGTYWKFRLEYCLNQNVTVCQNINIVKI